MKYRDGLPLWLKVYIIVAIILLITLFLGFLCLISDNKTAVKFPAVMTFGDVVYVTMPLRAEEAK